MHSWDLQPTTKHPAGFTNPLQSPNGVSGCTWALLNLNTTKKTQCFCSPRDFVGFPDPSFPAGAEPHVHSAGRGQEPAASTSTQTKAESGGTQHEVDPLWFIACARHLFPQSCNLEQSKITLVRSSSAVFLLTHLALTGTSVTCNPWLQDS